MSKYPRVHRRPFKFSVAAGALLSAAALSFGALSASAQAQTQAVPDASSNYQFQTYNDPADTTFNQLLGINELGEVAGYFGSGSSGHPNRGYTLPHDGMGQHFTSENFPGSAQTQVTGLNNKGVTVGFWANSGGANFGFYSMHGHFYRANYPTHDAASPAQDQLLGVNDQGVAVGFYMDGQKNTHGYTYSLVTHRFHPVNISGASSVTATAINNWGDIAGVETTQSGTTEGFLLRNDGSVVALNVPGSSMTQALGVNDGDEVVGFYQVGTGNTAKTHGFVWTPGLGFENVDDPNGIGQTSLNGVNDHGRVVGFYTDSKNNVDGFIATPQAS